METYRPVQCYVTAELHCALKMRAAQDYTTISHLVRDLIQDYINRGGAR